ncbi:MAG: hypothetical protein GTO18_00355 [Anaerolineales bacterium]|nr:hypothetical protein [Anaerolineales bacterium]
MRKAQYSFDMAAIDRELIFGEYLMDCVSGELGTMTGYLPSKTVSLSDATSCQASYSRANASHQILILVENFPGSEPTISIVIGTKLLP